MYINNYFNTAIWSEQKPEFIKSLNKASDKHIKEARKRNYLTLLQIFDIIMNDNERKTLCLK